MYKRFLLAVAFILISAALASAQTTGQTFERYNRWMVGGELIKRYNEDFGWGATGIYGRQFSEIIFLGIGVGVETHVRKDAPSSITIEKDGKTIERIFPPYNWMLSFPLYADLQINFSRNTAPFYAEVKAGLFADYRIRRVRGTESYNKISEGGSGIISGFAFGKRFALNNGDLLNISLGANCYLGAGPEVSAGLGITYGF